MILALGDSNMYPACTEMQEAPDSKNMVSRFADKLNKNFRCWSKNGASNYWIQTHIDYFLADPSWNSNTFLFVGWTSFEREEWPWLYSNISVCGGPDFGIPVPMKAKYDQWQQTLTDDYMQACIELWHERIYQMHQHLQDLDISHLFWTTYNNFKSIEDQRDWHGNFFKPYDEDGCMSKYFEKTGIKSIHGDPFHYDREAHDSWAGVLADYAKQKLL